MLNDPVWRELADIALRLEALPCSEATSERTNGTMRRILTPFSIAMSHETLLDRMIVGKHG